MDFVVKSEYDKKTVKEFLRENIDLSRTALIMLKNKSDGILVNGSRVTVRYMLSEGDILSLNYEDADKNFIEENHSLLHLLDIIYEDDFIFAVNKPPYMPSHPSLNHFDDTLANIVTAYYKKNNINSLYRAANRLDKNTSGIVLIAKDKIISARLNEAMKRGGIRKTYIAVLVGNVNRIYPNGGRIIAPIKREKDSIIKRVCAPDGDYAETLFKVLKSNADISVVEVYPITGRTHQIRLHFHSIGFPLLGEDLYCEPVGAGLVSALKGDGNVIEGDGNVIEGGDNAESGGDTKGGDKPRPYKYEINRHALHAYSLEFDHPQNNKKILIQCELPNDISSIINKM